MYYYKTFYLKNLITIILKHNYTILLFFLFLLISVSKGQEYAFRSFTTDDGLVSNYITSIKQDSKGYLWIGTDEGFSIFDGKNFVNIRPPKQPTWGHINRFVESKFEQDVMWIATNGGGLLKYSEGKYQNIVVDTSLAANRINDLLEDVDGVIWCATDNGLYKISEQSSQHIDLPTRFIKQINQITRFDAEHLWIAYQYGVISFSTVTDKSSEILKAEIHGTNGHIVSFPHNGTKAVITAHTVYIYSDGKFIKDISLSKGVLGNGIRDGANNLWIASTQCVYQLKNILDRFQVVNSFDVRNGLPVNDVSAIASDRENNLWFGTEGKGIVRLQDPENFRFRFEGLTSRGTSDETGRIWVPTLSGLKILERQSNHTWIETMHKFAPNKTPIAAQLISSDTLWVTNLNYGLTAYRIRQNKNRKQNFEQIITIDSGNGLPRIFTVLLYKDSRGFLWCGKEREGIVVVSTHGKPKIVNIFNSFPNVAPMTISAFTETSDGHIFAGGNGSNALLEFAFNKGTYQIVKIHRYDSLISPYGIRSLTSTSDGSMWIGTRYDGLLRRYPTGKIRHFTYSDGLHSMQILSLYSNEKSLWIGTQSGMEYVPNIDSPRFLLSTELTRSPIYTIGKFDENTIWAMSRYEVTLTNTKAVEIQQFIPPVYLTRFDVNGVSQSQSLQNEFSGSELISCSFIYTCVTLKGNIDVQFQYQLEGLHDQWQNATRERSVTFANLGAGQYTFRVRAILNNGEQITDSVTRSFIVVPPLWKRWWFTPFLLAIFFSIILGIYSLKIRQQVALEKIRVSIAADLHDEIGSTLARIANLADILVLHQSAKPVRQLKKRLNNKKIVPITNPKKIATLSRELLEKMSDVVWSVNPHNDDLKRLLDRVQTYTTEVAESHGMKLEFSIQGSFESRRIDPQTSRATLLIIKEALSNILVHAKATKINITVEISERLLAIQIRDNGIGFVENELPRVNGIYNMRNRAISCDGLMSIISEPNNGTELRLQLPI